MAKTPITLEPAAIEDAQILSQLHKQLFPSPWSEESFHNLLKKTNILALLARQEGEITGFIILQKASDEAEIIMLAVQQKYQGKGIGDLLCQNAISDLKQANIQNIFLEVDENNEAALALYKKLGFTIVGNRKAYYDIGNNKKAQDAYIMRKIINSQFHK